jgi:hypothetical protein
MSGAPSGQIGICFSPEGGCQTPTFLTSACCRSGVVGLFACAGSAPGLCITATPTAKPDNPKAHASIKVRRTIDPSLTERTLVALPPVTRKERSQGMRLRRLTPGVGGAHGALTIRELPGRVRRTPSPGAAFKFDGQSLLPKAL